MKQVKIETGAKINLQTIPAEHDRKLYVNKHWKMCKKAGKSIVISFPLDLEYSVLFVRNINVPLVVYYLKIRNLQFYFTLYKTKRNLFVKGVLSMCLFLLKGIIPHRTMLIVIKIHNNTTKLQQLHIKLK